jgi:uncharacterized protein (TIGR02466 family)
MGSATSTNDLETASKRLTPETWFEDSDVLRMFPTFVWKAQVTDRIHESIIAQLDAVLEDVRRGKPRLAYGEAWQSRQTLHRHAELRDLVCCFKSAVMNVLHHLKIGYDKFEITGCWANISAPGAAHRIHHHPNNFLSGVYYVKTRPGADTVNFHDPRAQTGIVRPPVTELTAENTDQVVVRVQAGTLLLFPSWLQHSVDPNQSSTTRISVSYNVMFSDFGEHLGKPLW